MAESVKSVHSGGLVIAVLDERPVIRHGVPQLLRGMPEIHCVRSLADVPEPDDVAQYDVIVCGIYSRDSLAALRRIHHLAGRSRLVLLADSPTLLATLLLADSGAHGYLTTDASGQVLREAVLGVWRGQLYVARSVADLLRDSATAVLKPRLAPREAQVVRHIAAGLTHAATARQMGVSVATVETYLRRIRNKYAINAPRDLVRLAWQVDLQRLLG
ncbi:response regulator transcription factor [Crossiella sp. SN42]|uniref:response regulator transcription factor n=1 Tax=Crossiella sp. SN42 TaxID=2944808 RepID=UPI00207CD50F|nr:response regulator transcription factor [Crossiella sp. SN42]MCO1580717.1 response regulator transcription factor [Crossiella sp. SN42]